MSQDKFTQISVSDEFLEVVNSACEKAGTSLLNFIKLSVVSMSKASDEDAVSALAELRLAEGNWGSTRVKKTIRISAEFKELLVEKIVINFNNNASLLYRASAFRMSNMNQQAMMVEVKSALEESIRRNYRILIR
jgi:hypothetical protein